MRGTPVAEHLTGTALDVEISRVVFGLEVATTETAPGYVVRGQHPAWPEHWGAPRAYHSDIKAAWRIVEHFRALGYLIRVQEHPDGWPFYLALDEHNMPDERSRVERRAMCLIELIGPASYEKPYRACEGRGYGASAPEAICRAALDLMDRQS